MASPRQKLSKNRHNTLWLINAASLVVAIGSVGHATKSNFENAVSVLVPKAQAVDYYWLGGTSASAADFKANAAWWSGTQTPLSSTNPATAGTVAGTLATDNLFFGSSPGAPGTVYSSTISWGSSNRTFGSLNFILGAPSYTFTANSTRKNDVGLSTQTQPAIYNASSSAITFNSILAPQGGSSTSAAVVFNQANSLGTLTVAGQNSSSYIINPYAYAWAISVGSSAAQAGTFATAQGRAQALALAGRSTSSPSYLKLTGSGTITVSGSMDDGYRNNRGSSTSSYGTPQAAGHLVVTNTATTYITGWNTYTGTTTIGDGIASGGTVVIGSPYAFGGNRVGDATAPSVQGSATAYYAGTTASGFSATTQAFGAVTVNSGFSVDLNGQTMIGANAMSIRGLGGNGTAPASTGVIRNTSTNAASYAGLISLAASSTMSASYGAITLAGGVNTVSSNLTVDGSSNTYITGPITGNSSGGIQKFGTGTLTLSGSNNFAGILTLKTGSVIVTSPDALSSLATLSSSGSTGDNGTLVLTGGLVNSDAYHMNALNFGGKLIFNTVGGNSTLTFDAASGNAQTGGASNKNLVINSGVTLKIAGSFDLVGSTSSLPARYLQIDGDGNIIFNGEVLNNATGAALTAGTKGGLNKNSGNGTLTLNGVNTFDAGVIFGAGTINVGSAEIAGVSGPLGSSGPLTMLGGTLQYSASNDYDYSSRFDTANTNPQKYNVDTNGRDVTWGTALTSTAGTLTKAGLGTLTLSGANTYAGGTTLAGGALQLDSADAIGSTGTITFTGGALRFTLTNALDYSSRFSTAALQQYSLDTGGQSVSIGTALTSSGGSLTKSGNGVLSLAASATYSGDTTINQGELSVASANNLSSTSSVVVKSGATLNLNTTNQSIKGLADAGTVSLGTANLTINDGDNRNFSGDITGGGNLIKSGSGTQTFSSTTSLSYSGSTSINAGVLKVNTTLASSPVTIASGATLEGKGNIAGSVVVASGGIITAGDSSLADASRGALTLSAVTFNGTAVINLANINTDTASSILNAGVISALGGAGSITINIDNTTPLANNATFTILKYTSLDDLTAFIKGTVSGASARQSTFISNDAANSQIILTTAGDTLKWSGSASLNPVWTTTPLNANWKLSSSGLDADYLPEDTVTFDDSATAFVVTLGETVLSGPITFDNSSSAYAVSSSNALFGIEGTKGLIKTGSALVDINVPLKISGGIIINNGTLALNNAGNTFTGNISLNNAGNLEVGATGALGSANSLTFGAGASGKLSLKGNNATLTGLYNNTGNVGTPIVENGSVTTNSTLTLNIASGTNTFDGVMQNGSTSSLLLTKTGSGTLVLTSDNTFTGQTTVTNGILQLGNAGATGSVAGDIVIGASGTLNLNRTGFLSTSAIFSGSGRLNLNYGQLELQGNNTFTGTTAISSGATLTIGANGSFSTSASFANNGTFEYAKLAAYNLGTISGTGDLKISAGSVTQTGVNSLTGSLTIGTTASYALSSTGSFSSITSITNNGTLNIGAHADYTIAAPISGTGELISGIGAGKILYLTQNNSYQGTTTINSGTLNVGNGTSTGLLGTGAVTIATGAELILSRLGDTTLSNTITGTGTGKLTIGTSGSLIVTTDNQIELAGELKIGASLGSSTHSTLDLTDASINVGSLRVQTDASSNSGINNIIIGPGKSLNIKGLVIVGLDNGANTNTNLTMSGNGTLNIGTLASPTNLNVNVGASSTASKINYVNWDMSPLATLNMYLGTGTFSVGADTNSTGGTGGNGVGTTVKLATTSTIVATTLLIDGVEANPKVFTLSLGAGNTILNVDTLTVGGANTRAINVLNFNTGTGTLTLRNKAGSGRAILNVQSATNSTGSNQVSTMDLSGYLVDLSMSTVTVGRRESLTGNGSGYGSGYLAFDTGTFDATTLNIANKSHNGTAVGTLNGKSPSSTMAGNMVGLVSFGGGNVIIGTVDVARHGASSTGGSVAGLMEFFGTNSSTVGAVTMATALATTTGTPNVTGSINIDGGSVYIASINGASAAGNTTATANVNLSGGTLTMGGNITLTGGSGTSAFNLNLSGGTLDMGGNTIGATGSDVTFNWTNGTLKNVSGLNGTAGITVDTGNQSNPVYLDGTNTFTSKITIKDSILQLQSTTALAANSQIGFVGTLGVLKLDLGVALDVSSNLSSGDAQFDTNGNDVIFNSPVSGLTSFTKLNAGKLTLSSTSGSLAPTVNILGGTLELGDVTNNIPLGGFLNGTTTLNLDAIGGSPELIANGVSVDLDAVVNLLNSGATISGTKGTSAYSFNFLKDIIAQDGSTATISATDMITGSTSLFNVGSSAILTISGSFIDGATATQINKTGTGLLELTGTGNTYSGATTVNAGTLTFYQGALTGSSTAITVNNGANLTALDLGANVSITVASGGTADISGTDLSVADIASENSTLDAFIFSGSGGKITAESLSGSGSTTFASDSLEVGDLSGAGSIVFSGGTSTIAAGSGTFSGTITGAQSFVKQGSGTLTISGNNALTGIVTLDGGVLSISDFDSLIAASTAENLVLQGGKLEYTGTAATMARGFTVGDGISGFIASGSDALTISGDMDFADASASNRTLSLGGLSQITVENIYNPNKIDAADVTNLFTKLEKQDTNKWIVLGAGEGFVDNSQIDIHNGELGFAMGALGSNSTIILGGLGGATATLGWANGNTEDVSGRITLKNNASAAFDIPSASTVTFGTALSGGIGTSVTKTGAGTLILDKSNSFSGGFTISGGMVKAGAVGSMGSGNVIVNSNSTLVVNAAITNTLTVNSGGIITIDTLNRDQSIQDATIMSGGTLVPGGDEIGTMTVRQLTLKGGSSVNWQIGDATGATIAGDYSQAGVGYDTFILDSLVLTDISPLKRIIHVKNTSSEGGVAQNFDKTAVQTFQFAKLTTALQSQVNVTDLFEIDASEFEYIHGLQTDQLVWYMTVSADREYLYVVAVPEPSTYGLGLGALALAFAAVRRRKQKKNPAVA